MWFIVWYHTHTYTYVQQVQFRPDDIVENGPNRMCHVYGFKNNNDMALSMIHDLIKTGLVRCVCACLCVRFFVCVLFFNVYVRQNWC